MKALIVNDSRAQEIEEIISIGPESLKEIASLLDKSNAKDAYFEVCNIFIDSSNEKKGNILARHAASFCMLAERKNESVDDVLDSLREGLVRYGWDASKLESFDKIRPNLCSIIKSEVFYISVKMNQILVDSTNHLHQFKIYTDSKPIFNKERSSVIANVVYSTLVAVASDAEETETRLSVALSSQDLERIRDECDNAIKKLEAYRKTLTNGKIGEVVVHGRDVD